ncbi:uncharacterized protein FIESC28_01641 [Fusarium coffeatum]|uniref:Uncharacterized protein n=1 Tax=Fusarium coffeatum TaxID=231269 RepID=A0A366S9S5_9HYPO|nr:uncharacterized protein FIESC28_01641 [Fusarium coffeatum]RBR25678.1 hypothetical protein FIESC28_01641 [Fusarium coffeatum]
MVPTNTSSTPTLSYRPAPDFTGGLRRLYSKMSTRLPSYEELRRNHVFPFNRRATGRLLWYVEGPLQENVFVRVEDSGPTGPREPYAQQFITNDTQWHGISKEPLTEPSISSITVRIYALDLYPDDWEDSHHRHMDCDSAMSVYEKRGGKKTLIECCGEYRPADHVPLLIKASSQPFIPVHDYVTTVHPWILSFQDEILAVTGEDRDAGSKLVLNCGALDSLMITTEDYLNFLRNLPEVSGAPDSWFIAPLPEFNHRVE